MFTKAIAAFAATWTLVAAGKKGYNYGSTFTTNAPKRLADFTAEFNQAKGVQGAPGFNSARLYTCIQPGLDNQVTPIEAFQAAVNTQTHLLLGLWASGGDENFDNEVAALTTAIRDLGTPFLDLIDGISVGSEDLYRISQVGIENHSNPGVGPDVIVRYIAQLRKALQAIPAANSAKLQIGHVDTYTAFINDTNAGVISQCDFLGMDAYPYYEYQNVIPNAIANGSKLFFQAYDLTVDHSQGKPVWITETGWPVSGPQSGAAVANIRNALTYWDAVACELFARNINTWWYTLQDAEPDTPSPSFGLVGAGGGETPLYDLTCSGGSNPPPGTNNAPSARVSSAPARPEQSNPAGGNGAGPAPQSSSAGSPGGSGAAAGEDEEVTETSTSMVTVSSCSSCPASSGGSGGSGSAPASVSASSVTSAPPSGGSGGSSGATSTYGGKSTAASPQPSAGGATPAPCPSASSGKSCPADLSGTYEYPHLIIPVDSSKPDNAPGTSYNGKFTSSVSSLFNFDIPASDAGKTCSLVFLLPNKADLETSSFTLASPGGLSVKGLSAPATEQTSYSSIPKTSSDLGTIGSLEPGHTYVISSFDCPAGSRIGFEASGTNGLDLDYFQDYNPSPIGMYITVC